MSEELPGYDEWKLRNDRDELSDDDRFDDHPTARDLFDMLNSDGKHACPDCGSHQTHPEPGCSCPTDQSGPIPFTRHINRNHHTCGWKP